MEITRDLAAKRRLVERLLAAEHTLEPEDFRGLVAGVLERREELVRAAERGGTPSYLFDEPGFVAALRRFRTAFDAVLPEHRPYYAVKSNHHPRVVATAAATGFGLDVSSGRELRQALAVADCPIVFSGPAKTTADLELAAAHAARTIVQLDSFRELERLGEVTARLGVRVRAGVRVSTAHHGAWSKFGIPLARLPELWQAAQAHPGVHLCGVQFHLSWNRDATPYVRILAALGRALAEGLTPAQRAEIAFIDVGGGYRPHRLEAAYPFDHPLAAAIRAADEFFGEDTEFAAPYCRKPSIPVEAYAEAIGAAIAREIRPLVDAAIFTEPGRIVSTHAMHILLRVVDRKADDLVILDGGINMVGWERYSQIYCPVINLTRPALDERVVRLGGSLCDCEDLWGYRVHAAALEEGDLLIVPYQGAYTFCTAQEFIRPIPPVIELVG